MSDNVAVTPGSGATIRTRDTGTAQVQGVDVAGMVPTSTGAPQTISATTSAATGKSGGGTFTLPAGTTHVLLSVETNNVRFTEDGATAPTSTLGCLITSGSIVELSLAMSLNFIGVGGTASLNVHPRKYI